MKKDRALSRPVTGQLTVIYSVFVMVFWPAAFLAVSVTVYVPFLEYEYVGFLAVE